MPTVREDVAFGPLNMGLPHAEVRARVAGALAAVRWPTSPIARRTSSRWASAGGSPSRRCSRWTRRCWCWTSRRRTSTRAPAASCWTCWRGSTARSCVVTHDLPFAAELCERAVILARGRVVADGDAGAMLGDDELLAANDLELPAGFDLDLIPLRPRPTPTGRAVPAAV